MQFIDLEAKKPRLSDIVQKASEQFHFHSVVVLGIDSSSGHLFDLFGSDDDNIEMLLRHCRPIIRLLQSEQKTLLFDSEFSYNNEIYHKFNEENSAEVYIPMFQEFGTDKTLSGIIYFEYKSEQDMSDLVSDDFKNYIREFSLLISYHFDSARKKLGAYHLAYMLCEIIDMKEPYAIGRLFDVALWCEHIAKEMRLPQTDIDKLQIAALMHDLGKIYISEDLLNKKGKLTNEEYQVIKRRVIYSYEIAESFKDLHGIYDLPEIILNYQERIDGKGYPYGKKGDDIPLLSKILGTAKAITAMLTNTSYSPAKSTLQVIQELKIHSGTQFDEAVVTAAIANLAREESFSEDDLLGIGSFAAVNMKVIRNGNEENLNLWGNIRRRSDVYEFTPSTKLLGYEDLIIQSCSLYISHNERIVDYIPTIKALTENIIVFSELTLDNEGNVFSINWMLPGLMVTPSRKVYDIFIIKIGGDYINFYMFSKNVDDDLVEGVIKLTFDDGKNVALSGIITSKEKIDDRVLFRFKYVNVSHEDMKLVYAELFRKQIALNAILRRLVNK